MRYKLQSIDVGTEAVKVVDYNKFKDIQQHLNTVRIIVTGANDVTLGYTDEIVVGDGYPIDATVEPREKVFNNLTQDIYAIAAVASKVSVDIEYFANGSVQV